MDRRSLLLSLLGSAGALFGLSSKARAGEVRMPQQTEPLSEACQDFLAKGALIASSEVFGLLLKHGHITYAANAYGEKYPMALGHPIVLSDREVRKFAFKD